MNPPSRSLAALVAPGLAFALCAAASFWLTEGIAPWSGDTQSVWRHYEYMAEGFAEGHTYLSREPSPELLNLKDPYDPAANLRYRLWDASLYRGKYYLYYGPTPAIALMVPWRLATGHMPTQRSTVALLAVGGLAGLGLLLWEVRRRHFPGLSGIALGLILITAFHASWLPVVLRRPGVWEVPIVSAVAFLWWALYLLWKFHDSGGKARWSVGIGLALALLMGSRATFVFAAGAVAVLALIPAAGPFPRLRALRKTGLPALALAFAGGVGLLVYNHERFGRWLEFGQSFQLWGADERNVAHFSLAYAPFNIWTYLFSHPAFGPYFPFLYPYWTDSFPRGYIAMEEMYGVLFMMPVHLAGLAALVWAWRSAEARPAKIVVAAAFTASTFSFVCLVCWAGACSRYIAELMGGWTLVTSVGLMAVFGRGSLPRPSRFIRIVVTASACWTIGCVWLASAQFRGFMKQTNPRTYAALSHALDYPSQWWIRLNGIRFAPVDMDVRLPASSSHSETVLLATGFPLRVNQLILDRVDGGRARLALNSNWFTVLETPSLAAKDDLHIRVSAPWLYPPAGHPYWDQFADLSKRTELQTLYSIQVGPDIFSAHSTHSFDASGFEPSVGGAPGAATVESLRTAAPAP
jgi:hypothetical protein